MSEENNEVVEAEVIEEHEQVVLQFSPALIDPKKEELKELALEVSSIDADPKTMTKETLELINTTKNKLVKNRTSIKKDLDAAIAPAKKFIADVRGYAKELIEILEPEELRMKELEKGAKEFALFEERRKTLPEYLERLASIGDDFDSLIEEHSDVYAKENYEDYLLSLDPTDRDVHYNERLSKHLEKQQAELAEKQRVEEEEKAAKEKEEAAAKAEADRKLKEEQDKLENDKRAIFLEKQNLRMQRFIALGFQDTGMRLVYGNVSYDKLVLTDIEDPIFEATLAEASGKIAEEKEQQRIDAELKAAQDIKEAEDRVRKEAEQKAADLKAQQEADATKAAEEKVLADKKAEEEALKRQNEERFNNWKDQFSATEEGEIDFTYYEQTDQTICVRVLGTYNHNN